MNQIKTASQNVRFKSHWWHWFFHPTFFLRRDLYRFIQQQATDFKGVLGDVGCGSKPYKHLFINAEQYVGMDMENEGHSHKNESIDIYFDGKHIPFEAAHFDNVISSEVLEHVFYPNEWLAEIGRIIKPEGKFLLTTPFMFHEHEVPNDFGRYSHYGLSYILKTHGFSIVEHRKAAPGAACLAVQWNVYWWKKWERLIHNKPAALILAWPFILFGNMFGLFSGLGNAATQTFYAGNLVCCKKDRT